MNKHRIYQLALGSTLLLATACNEDSKGGDLSGAKHEGYFAVLSSNFTGATSISLLGEDGEVVADEWAGSKTKNAKLHTPLSMDVVLPSVSESRRYLTTIERSLGTITRFDLNDGTVLGQVRTDESAADDKAAYHSNPQDVLYVSDESAWVSRWAPNLDDKAKDSEKGSDLIEFDPSTMKRTTRRIDLSKYATEVEETQYDKDFNPTGTVKSPAYARPQAIIAAGKFAVVGLVRSTESYTYAPGMVVVVDPDAGKVTGELELGAVENCGEVRPVLGADNQVLVACIGSWGDGGAAAGLFKLEVSDSGKAKIVRKFVMADHKDAANTNEYLVSLGGDLAVAVMAGSLDENMNTATPDAAYLVDLKSGKQTKLYESKGAYALGIPAYEEETGVLVLPDAGDTKAPLYGVQRFTVDASMKVEKDEFVKVAPKTTLAAREAHLL